jgi:hypothetical protein
VASVAMKFRAMQNFAFRTISQIGIHYPHSPLSQNLEGLPADGPRAGDRFPWVHLKFSNDSPAEDLFKRLDDTLFHLLVVGQPSQAPLESNGMVRIHEIPADPDNLKELARVKIFSPSFYVIRPDGYIGLAGTRLEPKTISRYMSERLQMRAPQSV